MPKLRTCIFVHGCFWHRHPDCRYAYAPKSRLDFWLPKFAKTVERDLAAQNALHELGWNVVIIWECETKKIELLRQKINEALAASS